VLPGAGGCSCHGGDVRLQPSLAALRLCAPSPSPSALSKASTLAHLPQVQPQPREDAAPQAQPAAASRRPVQDAGRTFDIPSPGSDIDVMTTKYDAMAKRIQQELAAERR